MNYEEKYKEALERAKMEMSKDGIKNDVIAIHLAETIFPELRESDDEKIRKSLITFFQRFPYTNLYDAGLNAKEVIAWLENQGEKDILEDAILDGYILDGNEDGLIAETIRYKKEKQAEQNQTDKVKPKFKVGDWIINPRTGLIKHIKNVLLCDNNGNYEFESSSMSIDSVDNSFHLWTIQDAKDGDVLYINNTLSESIMIYKSFNNGLIKKYASYNKFGFEGEHYLTLNDGYITPATKEQCIELFLKMHEAGYEWDAENKKLKKIEQKPLRMVSAEAKEAMYDKPAWSEEDVRVIDDIFYSINEESVIEGLNDRGIMYALKDIRGIVRYLRKWLKSLKDRVQPKQEWSEEDKNFMYDTLSNLTELKDRYGEGYGNVGKCIDWLKSLRPQNHWKPSDCQMRILDLAIRGGINHGTREETTLVLLYEDLKKLKEGKV